MARLSLGLRLSMTDLLLRSARKPSRTQLASPVSWSRAAAGDPLEPGVLHSTERVVMVTVAPLLMMMKLRIIE